MTKRILTVVGARPQFIKASAVSLSIAEQPELEEVLLHTGQHFDENMSEIFFTELKIPKPDIRLNINGGSHAEMTARMMVGIEDAILSEKPDRIMVYGDTNSTLAAVLAAAKLGVPIAHVEAGLRSFDRAMPEEINRLVADQLSDILFCPTDAAVQNLTREGMTSDAFHKVIKVGDVMLDAAMLFGNAAQAPAGLERDRGFILATVHRAENTDDMGRLSQIVSALNELHAEFGVVLPLHPRTVAALARAGLTLTANVIPPVSYLEMLWLLRRCALVVTDSGGLQKEAYFHGKSCVTLRDTTEWVELLDIGAAILAGAEQDQIVTAARGVFGREVECNVHLYGGGRASDDIAKALGGEESGLLGPGRHEDRKDAIQRT
jgi:UDP-GlcNAc3NAcA epimerase